MYHHDNKPKTLETGEGKDGVDVKLYIDSCILTALMWEWWEMQFPQIFVETESKILQVVLGREK